MSAIPQSRFQQFFLLALVLGVSAGFVWMIAGFLEALFLAALFAVFLFVFYSFLRLYFGFPIKVSEFE